MTGYLESCAKLRDSASQIDTLSIDCGGESTGALVIAEQMIAEPFRVLVIGEFSRGKSTFINALIGEKLLPSSVRPTTAVITVLRNGEHRAATIHWRDAAIEPQGVDIPPGLGAKELDKVVTAKNETGAEIARVEIVVPMPHLQLPFELVDTPGVNDIDTQREEITYSFLSRADAAIMMLDLQQPLSASEKRFLVEKVLSNDIHKLLFVVNKIDQESPEKLDRALAYVNKRLGEIDSCKNPRILPVAAKLALQSKISGDNAGLISSRFREFELSLKEFLEEASGRARIQTGARRIARFADHLEMSLGTLLLGLSGEERDLSRTLDNAVSERKVHELALQTLSFDIDAITSRYVDEVSTRIRARVATLRRETTQVMRRESFPSEPDVTEIKGLLNAGLREVMDIPADSARREGSQFLAKHRKDSNHKGLTISGGTNMQEVSLAFVQNNKQSSRYAQIGGTIGAVVGSVLFGPFGTILAAALGGAVAGAMGGGPDTSEIGLKITQYLTDIDIRSKEGVETSSLALRSFMVDEVLAPAKDAFVQNGRVVAELRSAYEIDAGGRRVRADQVRVLIERAQRIKAELAAVGEAA